MLRSLIKIGLRLVVWRPDLNLIVTLMASLCLLYKVEDLWSHRTLINWQNTSLVSQAHAEADAPKPKAPDQAETNEPKKEEFDPLMLDENQIKILQAMSKKDGDTTISDERAKIVQQEELVKIAKEKLNKQITKLEAIQKDIKSTTGDLTKKEKENIERMVKIYEAMKPVQAADILNKLELTALSEIMKAMNPKKASLILGAMDQNKVRLVTIVMLKDENAQLALKARETADKSDPNSPPKENSAQS